MELSVADRFASKIAALHSVSASKPGDKVTVLSFGKDQMIYDDAQQFILSETELAKYECEVVLLPKVSNVKDASDMIKKQRAQKEPVMLLVVDLDLLHHKKYQEANQNEELPSQYDEIYKFYELLRNYAPTSWLVVGYSSSERERKKKMKGLKKDLEERFRCKASADMILSKPWVPGQMEELIKKALEKLRRAREQSGI